MKKLKKKVKTSKVSTREKLTARERAKKQLKDMEERAAGRGGSKDGLNYMRFRPGKTIVRIYPHPSGDPDVDFWLEVPTHSNVGPDEQMMTCPSYLGKPCYVDEENEKLYKVALKAKKSGTKDQKKLSRLFAAASALRAKPRYYMQGNAIDPKTKKPVSTQDDNYGEPIDKPEIIGTGPMLYQAILAIYADDEADVSGDFLQKDNRYDFVVSRTGTDKESTRYTAAGTRKYVGAKTLTNKKACIDLAELFGEDRIPTYEQTKSIFLGEESEEEEDEELEDVEEDEADLAAEDAEDAEDAKDAEDEAEEEDDEESAPRKKGKLKSKSKK